MHSFIRRTVFAAMSICAASAIVANESVRLTPSDFHDAEQPQISAAADGALFVVFGRGEDIYVTRLANAATSAEPVKVGTIPGLALGKRRGPRIAVSGQAITITAMAADLFAFQSFDSGKTWSAAQRLNSVPGSASEGLHALAGAREGQRYVVWLDLRSGSMQLFGAGSRDGGKTWSHDELVYASPDGHICECCHPSAAFNDRGDLAVMWRNWLGGSRDLWRAVRSADSARFSAAQKEGSGTWKLDGCPMDGGAIFALPNGDFASTWRRGDSVYVSLGAGNETKIGEGTQPVARADTKGIHVFWQQGTDLMHSTVGPVDSKELLVSEAQFASLSAADGGGAAVAFERKNKQGSAIYLQTLR